MPLPPLFPKLPVLQSIGPDQHSLRKEIPEIKNTGKSPLLKLTNLEIRPIAVYGTEFARDIKPIPGNRQEKEIYILSVHKIVLTFLNDRCRFISSTYESELSNCARIIRRTEEITDLIPKEKNDTNQVLQALKRHCTKKFPGIATQVDLFLEEIAQREQPISPRFEEVKSNFPPADMQNLEIRPIYEIDLKAGREIRILSVHKVVLFFLGQRDAFQFINAMYRLKLSRYADISNRGNGEIHLIPKQGKDTNQVLQALKRRYAKKGLVTTATKVHYLLRKYLTDSL